MNNILTMALALLLSLGCGFLFFRNAPRWGLVDIPDSRKVHSHPTPRTGGLAMVCGGLIALMAGHSARIVAVPSVPWQTLVAGTGFILLGGMDDRFSYKPKHKFLLFLSLSLLAAWPWVMVVSSPQFVGIHLGACLVHPPRILCGLFLVFWFLAVPNAVNIDDAINGYMGGFTLLLLGVAAFHGTSTWIPMGALVGFLVFNWPKASHFMGDAGSFGCGFFIAECLLRSGGLVNPFFSLILTAPIALDVAMGIFRRMRLGMSLFAPDNSTFPHHVLAKTGGKVALATPLLWLNAGLFVLFLDRPFLAGTWALAYLSILWNLNKKHWQAAVAPKA